MSQYISETGNLQYVHIIQTSLASAKSFKRRNKENKSIILQQNMAILRHHEVRLSCFLLLIFTISSSMSFQQISLSSRARTPQTPTMMFPQSVLRIPSRGLRKKKTLTSHHLFVIRKGYFDTLEKQSGKDYEWIKPLNPVSSLMQ